MVHVILDRKEKRNRGVIEEKDGRDRRERQER